MLSFAKIRARAATRKGGEEALQSLLRPVMQPEQLAAVPDDRVLAEMTKRVFSAGFAWTVIEKKWPGFEEAFLGFDPGRLVFEPDDFWDARLSDKRIVRNGQKIMSVRRNAEFIGEIGEEHGSFGKFLAHWPATDQIGLWELLAKRGSRLGGNTGRYFLRFIGKDGFILTRDIALCLRDAGLEIAENPTSKRDLAKIQVLFDQWAQETGLPYTHLSRICAMSIGENYSAETLASYESEDQ
jgi:3-methyladenine DNA glycosylase Tag